MLVGLAAMVTVGATGAGEPQPDKANKNISKQSAGKRSRYVLMVGVRILEWPGMERRQSKVEIRPLVAWTDIVVIPPLAALSLE
jgi:hypothetical protein